MKTYSVSSWLIMVSLFLWAVEQSLALQATEFDDHAVSPHPPAAYTEAFQFYHESQDRYGERQVRRGSNPVSEAIQYWKEADDAQNKEQALDSIRRELAKQYDDFLQANEKQILDLQARLDQLRDQLERRRQAKAKMVELELERLINETEGLIWPSRNPWNGPFKESGFPGGAGAGPNASSGIGGGIGVTSGLFDPTPPVRKAPAPHRTGR